MRLTTEQTELEFFTKTNFQERHMNGATIKNVIGICRSGTAFSFALQTGDRRCDAHLDLTDLHSDLSSIIETIQTGLRSLADKAEVDIAVLEDIPTYLGLSGISSLHDAETVKLALPLKRAVIEDDRRSVVTGALGSENGSVVSIGTGSFVSRQINGEARLIGGYGTVLGNEASGSWLGKKLLERVLHCEDGLVKSSPIIKTAWDTFDGAPDKLLDFAQSANPGQFATFATAITNAAQKDDPNAKYLMRLGAAYIKRSLETLEYRSGETICLIGEFAEEYAALLPSPIAEDLRQPQGTALDGAIQLAQKLGSADSRPSGP
jgi:glucosamine kinase